MLVSEKSAGAEKTESRRNAPDRADAFAVVQNFADARQARVVHEHHAVHELHAVFAAGGSHFLEVGRADAARFFANDVLARRRRAHDPFLAQPGRQRNINGVHVRRREQFLVAAERGGGVRKRKLAPGSSRMNSRLRSRSRLATAVTTALPELKMAFQFFRPMPAVLKNPIRSFFINFELLVLVPPRFISNEDDHEDDAPAASRTRSKITSARCGSRADGGRIPDQFAVLFRRIAPGRLAGGKPLLERPLRFAEQNRNVLLRVQAVADEKRHDDQIFRLRERIAFGNARAFFKENRVDLRVKIHARGSIPPAARSAGANFHSSPCRARR